MESFPTELVDLSLRTTRTGMQSHLIVEMSFLKIFLIYAPVVKQKSQQTWQADVMGVGIRECIQMRWGGHRFSGGKSIGCRQANRSPRRIISSQMTTPSPPKHRRLDLHFLISSSFEYSNLIGQF